MLAGQHHEVALAQTLGWAQDAAARGEIGEAVDWLHVAEMVHGALPAEWLQLRDSWIGVERSAGGVASD
jgi:hypothetical protein